MRYHLSKTERRLHDRFLLESTQRCKQEPFIDTSGHFYYPFRQPFDGVEHLIKPAKCYICKERYQKLHAFYHRLCPRCAEENYSRRDQSANLEGYQAVVTGGRIKIGYHISLKLLRCGASLLLTTRFPKDALTRFSAEDDYEEWKNRLEVYAVDFRFLDDVMRFITFLKKQFSSIEIFINNAAQTIKRPDVYYLPHLRRENQLNLNAEECRHIVSPTNSKGLALVHKLDLEAKNTARNNCKLTDEFNEPVDKRTQNSWVETLGSVAPQDMVEAQVVNAIVPFLFCSQLKPLFLSSKKKRRFIINVSAMEGKFNRRNKTHFHPHTNMAKAALNMMTRTSAGDYQRDRIYMNSVDTGWITQEHPLPVRRKARERGVVPPLDCIDGASRVLAPVFDGILRTPEYGYFLKDYKSSQW